MLQTSDEQNGSIFRDLLKQYTGLSEANRAIRLRLGSAQGIFDDILLVKSISGHEALCGEMEYRLYCVSSHAGLPLKDLIALPVELQFVTDRGTTRSVCGIVTEASAGHDDGGLSTYCLVVRDALAIMDHRVNTRVFRNINEIDLSAALIDEWRAINPILSTAFDVDLSGLTNTYPAREFTMQHNESDAAFLRRLWKRRGISWFIRPRHASDVGSDSIPAHTLVLFDSPTGSTRMQRKQFNLGSTMLAKRWTASTVGVHREG